MSNILRILKRDILRLIKAPAALIVVGALLILPSIYTWYNVVAFWDPYGSTGNLTVGVVNEDLGAENELTGALNVGDTVTESLVSNDKLHFVSYTIDEAMSDLKKGDIYGVYVLPEDFSECLISPLTGNLESPRILYYANEKLGPVSPKITDAGATTIEQTINSMFISTVADAAAQAIAGALDDAEATLAAAHSKAEVRINAAATAIAETREKLKGVQAATENARSKVSSANAGLDDAAKIVGDAQTVLGDVSSEAESIQDGVSSILTNTSGSLSGIIDKVAQVHAKVSTALDGYTPLTESAKVRIEAMESRIQPAVDALNDLSTKLKKVASYLPGSYSSGKLTTAEEGSSAADSGLANEGLTAAQAQSMIDALESTSAEIEVIADTLPGEGTAKERLIKLAKNLAERADEIESVIGKVNELNEKIASASEAASTAANTLEESAKQAMTTLESYSNDLLGSLVPAITSTVNRINAACTELDATCAGLNTTIQQTKSVLNQLDGLLGECGSALSQTEGLIGNLQGDLNSVLTDAHLLAQSNVISNLAENGNLNSQTISAFMQSPTELEKVEFYHPNAYGTAMAPLFMNLTFWIGAFMLVIICRLEVDDEGIKNLRLHERYLSRFILFSGFAVVQAIVCCAGTLFLGVQAENIPALFVAAAISSLAYLSIIYALSTTLQHIGKALCIVLVFAQIPGGSGLYPLELTDAFFQTIYPLLPFSYGIDAMRESICGFYGSRYATDLGTLALMSVVSLVAGMALVPLMSNVIHMASRQIHEGDLYNGENALAPSRPYRLSQVVRALYDREDYRQTVEDRYERFNRRYPHFIRASIVLGVGAPVVVGLMLALNAAEKVVLLTVFLLWLVGLVVFLLIVESLRYSLERQLGIERLSGDRLIESLYNRDRMVTASAGDSYLGGPAPTSKPTATGTPAPPDMTVPFGGIKSSDTPSSIGETSVSHSSIETEAQSETTSRGDDGSADAEEADHA